MAIRLHSTHQYFGFGSARSGSQRQLAPWITQLMREAGRGGENSSGLTLIECLVAIIIITVVVAVITPPVFLAVGTRVNNRRTEQALQIAQAEIERVRLLMISNEPFADIDDSLPEISAGTAPDNLQTVAAPTTLCGDGPPPAACSNPLALFPTTSELVSNPGVPEFYVQTFRDEGAIVERTVDGVRVPETIAFNMGVRVYSREAVDGNAPAAGLLTEPGSLNFTSGTKTRGSKPLVVMYTELTRGTRPNVLSVMDEYIRENYSP